VSRRIVQRSLVGAAVIAFAVGGVGGTASAGEITGNGQLKEVKGKSICAYSGQNDGFHIPELAEDEIDAATRVQSYGQIVRHTGRLPFTPGQACNPNVPPPPHEE
jgi:hypothetical protein